MLEKKTPYHEIQVAQNNNIRTLYSGTGICKEQSAINLYDMREHVFDYSLLAMKGLSLVSNPSKILIIGLGGGVVPREARRLLFNAEIDIIEIDEEIINIAKQYFFFEQDEKMKVHKGDAFVITRGMEGRYDFIMLDAFLTNYTPFALMSVEFMHRISELASENSVISVNCCNSHPSFLSQIKTIRSVFGDCIYRMDGHRNSNSTTLYITKGLTYIPSKISFSQEKENVKILSLSNP